MENNEEIPELKTKTINGVEITNLEYAKIAMICDYLILDRYQDNCTFFRLEKCFGPFFMNEPKDFLTDVFKEICGTRRKYISLGRMILAYTKWKSKTSTNESFNKFMNLVFNEIVITQEQKIGEIKEGGRIFSTRNTRGRKVISRFSVLTDENKNKIRGFHIQYDNVFNTVLSPLKTRDNITLEMNFEPNGRDIRDRDGISHIGGKYSITKKCIKFMIFKCRSGKTFYIGDEKEEEGENIKFFLFGTSSCQLKSLRVELVDEQLNYFEPKFQPSVRINQKIVEFDAIDDNYINEYIINGGQLIFEENEIQDIPIEQLEENNGLIIPCINDDAFIDKKSLTEPLSGKDFNEIYKTLLVKESEIMEMEKENLKKKIYEKTIMRKHLLRVYLKKFKVKENISVLKAKPLPKTRISQDKFLAKIKAYRKKMDKTIEEKKEDKEEEKGEKEEKKENKDNKDDDNNYWDDDEEKDWPQDDGIEIKEVNDKEEEIKKEENKEINIEIPVEENNIIENKENENIEIKEGESNEPQKIVMRGKPKKLLKNRLNALKKLKEKEEEELAKKEEESNNNQENKKEEIKIEEPKIEIIQKEEPKKEEIIVEEHKIEEVKKEEPKIEEVKKEEPKKAEPKIEEVKKEEPKKEEKKNEIIINEKDAKDNNKININNKNVANKSDNKYISIGSDNNNINANTNNNTKKVNQSKPAKKWWCNIF